MPAPRRSAGSWPGFRRRSEPVPPARPPPPRWNAVRPTAAGVWLLLVLSGLTFGAVNTGNNLVYVVLSTLLAVLVVNNVLAEWNLRQLRVERVLPSELFAGDPATGRLVLINPRRWGGAWLVTVEERDAGAAKARFAHIPAGGRGEEPASWTFPERGLARAERMRLSSRFPFGLVTRWHEVDVPAEILVYPGISRGRVLAGDQGLGDATQARPAREGVGDLAGLRPYQAGDPVRRLHWPTAARTQALWIVLRAAEAGGQVVVHVGPGEAGIRDACGEVVLHTRRGDAVGLDLADGMRVPPRTGAVQRRHLLTTLALLPSREPR